MESDLQLRSNLLFAKDVDFESTLTKSAQSNIHFGKEKTTGLKVVVKEYNQNHAKGLFRELRIFQYIE